MAHSKVTIARNWYGKVPFDKYGKPIPRNLWPKRRKYSWEVRWYGSEGKRYSKSFKSRKEADEYARIVQEKVDKGRADKPRKVMLQYFIKEHGNLMKGQLAHSSVIDQMRALRLFVKYIGDDVPLTKITAQDVESFVAYRFGQGLAVATVNKDIRTLRRIFNLAISPRGYLAEGTNPFEKIKQRKTPKKTVHYVSITEFNKVFNAAPNLWWKSFLILAYTSGGRKNELLNLTWADIDFEGNSVSFTPRKASEKLLAWVPKDHEARTIPVPERVIQFLADLQSQADHCSPYVFITGQRLKRILDRRSNNKWLTTSEMINNMLRKLKSHCKTAGVVPFSFHDLRRSCITNWAKHLPIHAVQELSGHSKIETTRRYYLSVEQSDIAMARTIQEQVLAKLTNN